MQWNELKGSTFNFCLQEVTEGLDVKLLFKRKVSAIIRGGRPSYSFDGPENYKGLCKKAFSVMDRMNAEELTINLTEADSEKYFLKKGMPVIESIQIKVSGKEGHVDQYGTVAFSEEMGFIYISPIAMPASFSYAVESENAQNARSILDKMISIPSLFGRLNHKPKYLLTQTEGEKEWDCITLMEDLLLATTE